jgi:hypothetical protein
MLSLRLAAVPQAPQATANTVASRAPETEVASGDSAAIAAQDFYASREFEKALPAAEQAVQDAWKEYGANDYHTIAAEEFLAHLAVLSKDPARAKLIREETDRKLASLGDPNLKEKIRTIRTENTDSAEPDKEK